MWGRGVVSVEEGCGVGEWSVWRRVVGYGSGQCGEGLWGRAVVRLEEGCGVGEW